MMDNVTAADVTWRDRARSAWSIVVGTAWNCALFAVLFALLRGVPAATSYARVYVNEFRCASRLRDYVARAIPGRRGAEVEACKLPDAKTGYCFVSALGDDGTRRTEALPVSIARQNAIDVDRFVDEEGAKKAPFLPVAGTIIDRIAAAK